MTTKQKKPRSGGNNSTRKVNVAFSVRDYPFYYMHAIVVRNNRNIGEALRSMELTPSIWRILALLQEQDGITIGELSDESLIDRTLLSRILQDLERRRLVRRSLDSGDKRRVSIYLEPKGAALFQKILPIARSQIERAIQGLSVSEARRLQSLLLRIAENVRRLPSPP
jgi:MarR family transcriptional regulator, organic hydroperoxide resistance regulator